MLMGIILIFVSDDFCEPLFRRFRGGHRRFAGRSLAVRGGGVAVGSSRGSWVYASESRAILLNVFSILFFKVFFLVILFFFLRGIRAFRPHAPS